MMCRAVGEVVLRLVGMGVGVRLGCLYFILEVVGSYRRGGSRGR